MTLNSASSSAFSAVALRVFRRARGKSLEILEAVRKLRVSVLINHSLESGNPDDRELSPSFRSDPCLRNQVVHHHLSLLSPSSLANSVKSFLPLRLYDSPVVPIC